MHVPIPIRGMLSLPFKLAGVLISRMNPHLCTLCETKFRSVKKAQQVTVRATVLFVERLSLFREAGDRRGLAKCLAGLAAVAAEGMQPVRAAQLFGASEALLIAIGAQLSASNLDDYERNLALARKSLDAAAFAVAWLAGQTMAPEQAIASALEPTVPT